MDALRSTFIWEHLLLHLHLHLQVLECNQVMSNMKSKTLRLICNMGGRLHLQTVKTINEEEYAVASGNVKRKLAKKLKIKIRKAKEFDNRMLLKRLQQLIKKFERQLLSLSPFTYGRMRVIEEDVYMTFGLLCYLDHVVFKLRSVPRQFPTLRGWTNEDIKFRAEKEFELIRRKKLIKRNITTDVLKLKLKLKIEHECQRSRGEPTLPTGVIFVDLELGISTIEVQGLNCDVQDVLKRGTMNFMHCNSTTLPAGTCFVFQPSLFLLFLFYFLHLL
ncbi:hypothetical protein Cgig2_000438 [Carnegiea gigantea]|uniref:Uncharacterized protein n=1 Tax=Carnegiea gigantea TaxID=171969 RepID=A0A9Q1GMR5_9CARY|nr:hypothetical protein Cgig2_000438 [Carnegiea gigantea]